jgi:hypothetical protein
MPLQTAIGLFRKTFTSTSLSVVRPAAAARCAVLEMVPVPRYRVLPFRCVNTGAATVWVFCTCSGLQLVGLEFLPPPSAPNPHPCSSTWLFRILYERFAASRPLSTSDSLNPTSSGGWEPCAHFHATGLSLSRSSRMSLLFSIRRLCSSARGSRAPSRCLWS